MRRGLIAMAMLASGGAMTVSGCGLLPASGPQEFVVSGAVPVAQAEPFKNTDPNINDVLARQFCANGYKKLDEATLPGDPGEIVTWKIRCHAYWLSFPPF